MKGQLSRIVEVIPGRQTSHHTLCVLGGGEGQVRYKPEVPLHLLLDLAIYLLPLELEARPFPRDLLAVGGFLVPFPAAVVALLLSGRFQSICFSADPFPKV